MWIELHQAVWTHRKTFELAALLGVDETYAAAHVIRLWSWALDNAPDGDLSALSDRAIAFGAGWKHEVSLFVSALVKAGWLDETKAIHDWAEYAGRLVERREANAERMRRARAARMLGEGSRLLGDGCEEQLPTSPNTQQPPPPTQIVPAPSQHVRSTSGVTFAGRVGLPDRTGPDITGPDRTPTPQPPPATEREGERPTRGTRRRRDRSQATDEPALVGRYGWSGCPAGCSTNHGGPKAANGLGADWLAAPPADRPPWTAYLAQHGRQDLADLPAPNADAVEVVIFEHEPVSTGGHDAVE